MLKQISIRQFCEWRAYADLEPFDEERADLRAASIVQAVLNASTAIVQATLRDRRRRPPVELQDCALRFGDDAATPQPLAPEKARKQVRQTMDILMAIYNQPERKPKKQGGR